MAKQSRSLPVMRAVVDVVVERLFEGDESLIRIPDVCEATGVNYGSVYHHFGSREGVIDAAYDQIFSTLAREDIDRLREVSLASTSREEYVSAMAPLIEVMTADDGRRARRAMRARVIAAAATRPALRELIGATQARLTTELARVIEYGQGRGWLRRDLSAHAIAVVLQCVVFGRGLDDVSSEPIAAPDWSRTLYTLFADLLIARAEQPSEIMN
ncbi:MAG: TetR/AcrR family transcriptional regulator [Acidimicrobiales bacterium]